MNLKRHIPNTLTCANLACGCLALVKAFDGDLVWAAYLLGFALIFDFLDGFMARLLKVSSAIGKDLDSLADMVTFGVVPGLVMFKLILFAVTKEDSSEAIDELAANSQNIGEQLWMSANLNLKSDSLLPYLGFVLTIFSAIRLAKFNNDTRQSTSFIGLPTPANAMFIVALPLILAFQPRYSFIIDMLDEAWFLLALTGIFSYLLIAEIPLFALKFKSFGWQENKLIYLFLLSSVLLLSILQFIAIPLIIILYILVSIVNNMFLKTKV